MELHPAQLKLIEIIQNFDDNINLNSIIYATSETLQEAYPIEDSQLLLDEFNQALAGAWQNVLFESNLKYGQAYVEDTENIPPLELETKTIQNNQYIINHGTNLWYRIDDKSIQPATSQDVIENISQLDIDAAIENAANWDEVECSESMQEATGIYN